MTQEEYKRIKDNSDVELQTVLDVCEAKYGAITIKRLVGAIMSVPMSHGNTAIKYLLSDNDREYQRLYNTYVTSVNEKISIGDSIADAEASRLLLFCEAQFVKPEHKLTSTDIIAGIMREYPNMLISGVLRSSAKSARLLQEIRAEEAAGNKDEAQPEPEVKSAQVMFTHSKEVSFKPSMLIHNREIEKQIITILCKEYKPHVLLVGENGCGKRSIINAVLNRLDKSDVPQKLVGYKYTLMDNTSVITHGVMHSSPDTRMEEFIATVKDKNIVTIINDLDDFSDLDEPGSLRLFTSLSEDAIPVIATTTPTGLSYLTRIPNFSGLFDVINVENADEKTTKAVLKLHAKSMSRHSKIKFNTAKLDIIYDLCKRYKSNYVMPGDAVNILDLTFAAAAYNNKVDEQLAVLYQKRDKIHEDVKKAARLGTAAYQKAKVLEDEIERSIADAERLHGEGEEPTQITDENIKTAVSHATGIEVKNLNLNDKEHLYNIGDRLKKRIIGQDEVVDKIASVVKKAKLGLGSENRTRGNLLFIGQSGVGKTLVAKELARELYGDENALVRFDMSEYSEKHSVSKLIGAPPGYVGYDNGGQLTSKVSQKKNCVILLDEVEKAHKDIFDVFLQVFDDGRLTDGIGSTVDFRNCFIILTSNIGTASVNNGMYGIGYENDVDTVEKRNKEIIESSVKKYFKPEFINRLDSIMYFNSLSDDDIKRITNLEVSKFIERISKKGYTLAIGDGVIEKLAALDKKERKMGARPIIRKIETEVEEKLVDEILLNGSAKKFEAYIDNDTIKVRVASKRRKAIKEQQTSESL